MGAVMVLQRATEITEVSTEDYVMYWWWERPTV